MVDFETHQHLLACDAQDPAAGPGWFESSWDLLQGLTVREGLPPDATFDECRALFAGFSRATPAT